MDGEITGYTLSVGIYKKVKALGMKDPRYYIYASLRGSGLGMRDSWSIAFQGYGFNWAKDVLEREMNKLESLESVQKRIAEIQGVKKENTDAETLSTEELARATSKEQILTDLVVARSKIRNTASKEWADLTKLIADYTKIKQDDLQTEDTTCHFYLPVDYPSDCQSCLIFKNGKATFQKKK